MRKPVEAIERMREFWKRGNYWDDSVKDCLAYLDSIPDDAHICKWPEGLTRERLDNMGVKLKGYAITHANDVGIMGCAEALSALSAIAPERPKKRMVELWKCDDTGELRTRDVATGTDWTFPGWRKVGGPFEIEE